MINMEKLVLFGPSERNFRVDNAGLKAWFPSSYNPEMITHTDFGAFATLLEDEEVPMVRFRIRSLPD